MTINRAYSVLTLKGIDEESRIIEGMATAPTPDRSMDIVETAGIAFKLPLPLLYHHNSRQPIGHVTAAKVTKDGIQIKAQIERSLDAEVPYIKEAWNLIKTGLIRGLSIGFRGIEEAFNKETGGFHFLKTEWLELSAVTIPMHQDANITTVKSADALMLAASGNGHSVVRLTPPSTPPGVSGTNRKANMTLSEQITQFENKRAANVARQDALMTKAGDTGSTLDVTEQEEYDTLDTEVKGIDAHLVRLKAHQARIVATAKPVTPENTSTPEKAAETRGNGGGGVIQVRSMAPKGTTFSRWVLAQIHAKGDMDRAADYSRKAWPDMPEVEMILRAQVLPGTTTATTWAAPLIPAAQNMQNEFLDLLRPATLIGRIPGLRRVPANISVPAQTGGATFQWVGEGVAKPVSALAFAAVTLRWAKAAGIVVITKELARYSSPDAEATVRNSMVKDCGKFLDEQFITPTVAEVTNVSPAAITNGATTAAASGVTAAAFEADLTTAIATFVNANDDVTQLVILMSGGVALNVMKLRDALGNKIYPEMTLTGGTIMGLPVIVSNSVGARIVVLNANDILYNDDGPIEIDASEQASIIMDDTPAASPQTTSLVSLWQHNYLGIRVEKWTTWKRARSTSVYYISNAVYSG